MTGATAPAPCSMQYAVRNAVTWFYDMVLEHSDKVLHKTGDYDLRAETNVLYTNMGYLVATSKQLLATCEKAFHRLFSIPFLLFGQSEPPIDK